MLASLVLSSSKATMQDNSSSYSIQWNDVELDDLFYLWLTDSNKTKRNLPKLRQGTGTGAFLLKTDMGQLQVQI